MLVGGNGPGTEDRVLAFGDGWLPQCGPLQSVEELAGRIASLQSRAREAGRGPVPVTLFGTPPRLLGEFADAGVDRCLLTLGPGDEVNLLSTLDKWAELRPPRSS